ncbi:uncharacterized protein LOC114586931 [Podarcis muralis]
MFVSFLGILLLSLHTAGSQGITEIPQRLARISAPPGATVNISCNIPEGTFVSVVSWYKEEQEGGLHKIADIYTTQPPGAKTPSQVNLTRHNIQGGDSGVYYCVGAVAHKFTFLSGMRLIVLGTSGPRLALLAPSAAEDTELSHHVPLLCLLIDANPDEDTFSWDIGGETSQDRKDGDVIDGEGAFTVWSLKLIPPERWSQGVAYSCSGQERRNISAVVPSKTASTTQEDCRNILLIGIPCLVVVLLIPPLVLLCRKLRSGGNADAPANQLPMREIPQVIHHPSILFSRDAQLNLFAHCAYNTGPLGALSGLAAGGEAREAILLTPGVSQL